MTERERLIQFINQKQNSGYKIGTCQMDEIHCSNAELADYLLAIGVTILPCRVSDILYYHNLKDDECYKGEPISKWNIIENNEYTQVREPALIATLDDVKSMKIK